MTVRSKLLKCHYWLGTRKSVERKAAVDGRWCSRARGVATCAHGRLALARPSDCILTLPTGSQPSVGSLASRLPVGYSVYVPVATISITNVIQIGTAEKLFHPIIKFRERFRNCIFRLFANCPRANSRVC